MSIRINPNPASDLLNAIALNKQAQNTALQEISTGQSVNQLSDDPSAAAQVVLNHAQNSENVQYLTNITALQPGKRRRSTRR
jgi:flagellin-like hook-associated protein FlgL